MENKVRDLNKQKNDEKLNNKKLKNIKKERYTKALNNYEQIIKNKKNKTQNAENTIFKLRKEIEFNKK